MRPARRQALGALVAVIASLPVHDAGAVPRAPVAVGQAEPARAAPRRAEDALADSAWLLRLVRQLADPGLEGRGAGTGGLERTAALLRGQMQALGLRPAGDHGGFDQPFEVTTGVEVVEPTAVVVGGARHAVGPAFAPLGFSGNGSLTAAVAFAGYGITAPGYDYDDYAGLDVRGRIVLVLSNEPGELDSTSRFDGTVNTPHAELRTKVINAREHGAAGMLAVNGPRWHAGEPVRRPRSGGPGYLTSGLLAGWVADSLGEALMHGAGTTLAQAQMAIDSLTRPHGLLLPDSVTLTVTLVRTRAEVCNVVGRLPGRDTSRVLVLGAHYDHLGYGGESSVRPGGWRSARDRAGSPSTTSSSRASRARRSGSWALRTSWISRRGRWAASRPCSTWTWWAACGRTG